MAVASYKLTSDGRIITSDQGVRSQGWWSTSPAIGVGAGYEVLAEIKSATKTTPQGIFDEWLPLISDRGWFIDVAIQGMATITIKIRDIFSKDIMAQADVTLGTFTPIWDGSFPVTFIQGDTPEASVFTSFAQYIDLAKTSKDRVIVGAPGSDLTGSNAGAAHIYRKDGNVWVLEETINQPAPAVNDAFGGFVSLNGDGSLALIQATGIAANNNSVFVYQRTGTTWSFVQQYTSTITGIPHSESFPTLNEAGDRFFLLGSGENRQLEVAEWNGSIFVIKQLFEYSGLSTNTWGEAMSINRDGSVIAVPQRGIGLFSRIEDDGTGNYIQGVDTSGVDNSPITENSTALAGTGLSSIGVFAIENSTFISNWYWNDDIGRYMENTSLTPDAGEPIAISEDSFRLPNVADSEGGSVSIYEGEGVGSYTQTNILEPDNLQNPSTARALSISYDGQLIVVGNENWGGSSQGRFFTFEV